MLSDESSSKVAGGMIRRGSPTGTPNHGDDDDGVELASFIVPPSTEAPGDMMSYHIEASKRLSRIDERERDRARILRLPAGWDMHKLKQSVKLGLAAIVCLVVTVRFLGHARSARHERYQDHLAHQPVNYNGYSLLPQTVEKVVNYRNNHTALMVNLHLGVMHSTSDYRDDIMYQDIVNDEDYICKVIGRSYLVNQQSPRFHCRIDIHQDQLHVKLTPDFPPKSLALTNEDIRAVRHFWHMIDWYTYDADTVEGQEAIDSEATSDTDSNRHDQQQQQLLADTDWRNPNLISILVMVDPMERLLADSWAFFQRTLPRRDVQRTIDDRSVGSPPWWTFVKETPENHVMQQLGRRHTDTTRTKPKIVMAQAKELLKEFTFVLDSACLEKGVQQVADILDIVVDEPLPDRNNATWAPKESMPVDVYRKLMQDNQLDMELYQWSKSISLVRC